MLTSTAVNLYCVSFYIDDNADSLVTKIRTRVSVCAPSRLGSSADDVCENVRCWPGIGVIHQGVDFFVRNIVNTKSLFDESVFDEEFGFAIGAIGTGEVIM